MEKRFDHIGIWTNEAQPNEFWVPTSECWVTNPRLDPQRIEFIRPKNRPVIDPSDRPLWLFWNTPHVAYRVENLQKAIEGERVVYGPFEPGDFATIVFIFKDGFIQEYLEYKSLDVWFGQPTPWNSIGS